MKPFLYMIRLILFPHSGTVFSWQLPNCLGFPRLVALYIRKSLLKCTISDHIILYLASVALKINPSRDLPFRKIDRTHNLRNISRIDLRHPDTITVYYLNSYYYISPLHA